MKELTSEEVRNLPNGTEIKFRERIYIPTEAGLPIFEAK